MSAHHDEELHEWAGAYALGALDPDDRRRFERHLADCARCTTDIRALAPIPGLLAQLDTADLESSIRPETADAISRRIQHETQQLRTSRNRWRLAAATAAAVAMIAVISAIAIVADGPSTESADPAVAASVTVSLAESTDITTTTRRWGTQIDLRFTGLPARPRYQLWAIDDDGTWSIAATWGPTENGRAKITGATATLVDQLGRLVVTSDDTDDIIVDATTA
jgi:anti-sigma-K factor RskA